MKQVFPALALGFASSLPFVALAQSTPSMPAAPSAQSSQSTSVPRQTPAPADAAGQAPGGTSQGNATRSTDTKPSQLRLHSLAPDALADPFPPVDPKNFTASSPTAAETDAYLHAVLGYDPDRIWRVEAIQTTPAAGVSKITVLVSEKKPNAKLQHAVFYTLPDGKHLLAEGAGVLPFSANPYADTAKTLLARADGPWMGAPEKSLLFVEFTDLQCPHCKEAQATMKRLASDYPNAHIVYAAFPLVDAHPFAFRAAEYGVCVAKKSNEAFFRYADAVYSNQAALTEATGEQTLKDAVTKAGADPATVAACAAAPETKANVEASIKLGRDVGVDQTPTLLVNGRALPIGSVSYETLKQVINYQAQQDGVQVRHEIPALK